MIDSEDFQRISQDIETFQMEQVLVRKYAQNVVMLCKQAIQKCRHKLPNEAQELLAFVEPLVRSNIKLVEENIPLRSNLYILGMELYVEARCYVYFLATDSLLSSSAFDTIRFDEYLGGVISFTHELSRYAQLQAIDGDIEAVRKCHAVVEKLNTELMKFPFRNGDLRRKYDGVKYSWKTLENTLRGTFLAADRIEKSSDTNETIVI